MSYALQSIERIAEKRKVRHRVEVINQDPPATCSQKVLHTSCSSWVKKLAAIFRTLPLVEQRRKHMYHTYCLACFNVQVLTKPDTVRCAQQLCSRPKLVSTC